MKETGISKCQKNKIILMTILIIIFILIWILIQNGSMKVFDDYVYSIIKNIQNEGLTDVLIIFTNLGGTVSLFFIMLVTVIGMFVTKKRKDGVSVTLNLLISTCTYVVLKSLFQRPRPPIDERLIEETGYSFPSGHSTNNMAFYAFLIFLVWQNIENKKVRNVLTVLLSCIPVIIGFSRIYLRVHYPSDVIAGFCLGVLVVIFFTSTIYKKIKD